MEDAGLAARCVERGKETGRKHRKPEQPEAVASSSSWARSSVTTTSFAQRCGRRALEKRQARSRQDVQAAGGTAGGAGEVDIRWHCMR